MKLAIFTNLLTPYRISFFDQLYSITQDTGDGFKVYAMADNTKDRPWHYADYERCYTTLLSGFTIHSLRFSHIHMNTAIEKEIRSYQPDIVVMAGSYFQPTNIRLLRLAKKYGFKTVFWSESHFDELRNLNHTTRTIREWVRRNTLGRMDAFWIPGKKAEAFVDHYRSARSRKIFVPNTIDNTFFVRSDTEAPGKGIHPITTLFTPARLVKDKGILPFMDILKTIPAETYLWKIAGSGPLATQITEKALQTGCSIQLVGQKNQEEIRTLNQTSDIFVLPSIADANPLSCIEALWMGMPLFVSDHVGNYPEVISEGINGNVFSYAHPDIASRELQAIIHADKTWLDTASQESLRIAKERFSIHQVARQTIEETRSLLHHAE